ncbi:hypothetical protein RXV94_05065 [Yeosuana sp. MJ-SS3]|uniref:TonB C-terminal domain-containing protein n=1 Tax=Gilvirhabdus luticola TaxID=3079858 RepID=A0ABU3U535_9FLAO|nr:hypothetical protein [Yeosuana sp. MJ-SS3]MDU8885523.1 hypothetical protein [Yeosuana sp. MJ-SS3]
MKNNLLLFLALTLISSIHSQDSIVNYLDGKGKIVNKKYATQIETLVKKDSLWLVTTYFGNGKIKNIGHYKNKDKKQRIGEFVTYHRNGQTSDILFYNNKNEREGRSQAWFDTGTLSFDGIYLGDKKEGAWKYYHFNGKEASRVYYKNDSILKAIVFDEEGNQFNVPLLSSKPKFKGGIESFYSKIKKLSKDIGYKINGKINVHYIIGVHGEIKDVIIDEELPEELNKHIVSFFEAIEGWEPAIHMNRKIPIHQTIPIGFKAQ